MRKRITPRRRATVGGALLAVTAMITMGMQSGTASAGPDTSKLGKPDAGELPVKLSAPQRADLLKAASDTRAETAKALKLGTKERLKPRDVVKNADGSVHTRYERTYDGLPVLGGDMVVHETRSGNDRGRRQGDKGQDRGRHDRGDREAPSPKKKGGKGPARSSGRRRASPPWPGRPSPAARRRTARPTSCTRSPTRAAARSCSRTRVCRTAPATASTAARSPRHLGFGRKSYSMNDDRARWGNKTYNLNRGTSGTGTLFTDADDVWGDGNGLTTPRPPAVDAHYGAGRDLGLLQERARP